MQLLAAVPKKQWEYIYKYYYRHANYFKVFKIVQNTSLGLAVFWPLIAVYIKNIYTNDLYIWI